MTVEEAIELLGKELPRPKALKVAQTLLNWYDEQDEDECIPIALFGTTKDKGMVITNRLEEQDHWVDDSPVICNAMYLSHDQKSTISVQIIDPTEH